MGVSRIRRRLRRAKEDAGSSRKLSLFHFSARSFWSLITTNRLLIFLIDELAAASPPCGGRGRELQPNRNHFSVTFSHESCRPVHTTLRITTDRTATRR